MSGFRFPVPGFRAPATLSVVLLLLPTATVRAAPLLVPARPAPAATRAAAGLPPVARVHLCELVRAFRPELAPADRHSTTQCLSGRSTDRHFQRPYAHLAPVASCSARVCAEGLAAAGLDAARARRAIEREFPGGDTVASEALLPAGGWGGLLSLYRGRSWFTAGAAHGHNELGCETYDVSTGRRITLARLNGAAGRRALRALLGSLRAWRRETGEDALDGHRIVPDAFRVEDGGDGSGRVVLCAPPASPIGAGGELVELPLPGRWRRP